MNFALRLQCSLGQLKVVVWTTGYSIQYDQSWSEQHFALCTEVIMFRQKLLVLAYSLVPPAVALKTP